MTDKNAGSGTSRVEPLSVVWRFFAAPGILMVLLGLVALALVLLTLIPQIPSQEATDPQAWLAAQPGLSGQYGGLVRALHLYDIPHSLWFHSLLALAGLALFVWLVESIELAWRAAKARWRAAAFVFWGDGAPQASLFSSLSAEDIQARLGEALERRGYRRAGVADLTPSNLVGSRRVYVLWARPVVYGALLVVLAGLGIAVGGGWQDEDWTPVPGESRPVGHESPYSVRLDAFDLQLAEDGRLCGLQSEISWLEGGMVAGQDGVRIGRPAVRQGVAVRQVGYVPAVKVRGQDGDGQPLMFQAAEEGTRPAPVLDVTFPTPDARQFVLIPEKDLGIVLTFEPLSVEGTPSLYVSLLRDGGGEGPLAVLHESGAVAMGGLQIEIGLDYRSLLRIDHRPGMGFVMGGMALALVALVAAWLLPPRLVWIAVGPERDGSTLIQLLALPRSRGGRWLGRLASSLREVLADDA
jgi:hypothetical protein